MAAPTSSGSSSEAKTSGPEVSEFATWPTANFRIEQPARPSNIASTRRAGPSPLDLQRGIGPGPAGRTAETGRIGGAIVQSSVTSVCRGAGERYARTRQEASLHRSGGQAGSLVETRRGARHARDGG